MAEAVLAGKASKRAKAVIKAFLERGSMSTDDLAALGYGHPPRALGDVKDAGIPVVKDMVRSALTGRRMAVYRFGAAETVQARSIGGRRQFPKTFKPLLIAYYGSEDRITRAKLDPKTLQIDHRVPYLVAGDRDALVVEDYMLLDASSQRAKSWACENCPNISSHKRDEVICRTCFWAYPENYQHIATTQIRRVDMIFQGDDVAIYDRLKELAEAQKTTIADLLKSAARQIASSV